MPKERYSYLTDATREALTDKVKAMAAGWNKSESFIYQILEENKDDYFAAFLSMYQGACKGGVPTEAWDNELAYIRQKYHREIPERETAEVFQNKFKSSNAIFESYLAAIADGKLTLEEVKDLELLLDADDGIKAGVRAALRSHRAKLEAERR
jgi:hypothetical protein